MKIAIINLTGGGMSGGYRKYLANVLPRIAKHPEVEAMLCVSPNTLNMEELLGFIPNVEFISCKPLGLISNRIEAKLKMSLERFSPDDIYL